MASQSKRAQQGASSEADDAVGGGLAAASSWAEMSRQQMAAGVETLGALFRAGEAIQQAQLHMGQRAALLHSQAADNIRKATTPMELASIQSTLAMYEFQEAMRFWQELLAASAKASGEMLRRTQAQQDPAVSSSAPSAAATMMGAAMNAAGPMADAFQQMFTAPLKAAAAQQQPH
jgi:hypothetical protein